jgi:hypothetical protein
MNKTTISLVLAGLVALLACGAATAAYIGGRSTIRHADEALARANEYFNAGALFFEPRYAEAEKAVADANNIFFRDPIEAALLRSCLVDVKLSRSWMEMSIQQGENLNALIGDKASPDQIAKSRTLLDDVQRKMTETMTRAHNCAPSIVVTP